MATKQNKERNNLLALTGVAALLAIAVNFAITSINSNKRNRKKKGIGVEDDEIQKQSQTSLSLLSDWNSYASSRVSEESSTTLVAGFDLKAVIRSTNDSVTGTFDVPVNCKNGSIWAF